MPRNSGDQKKGSYLTGAVVRRRLAALFRQPIFWFITIWGHLAIALGTLGFYYFEHASNPRIHGILDTLFWAVSTVTTVGDGDFAPVTPGGKIIGIFMMILGSLFLVSYTALFAGAIVSPELKQVEDEVAELEKNVGLVKREIQLDEKALRTLRHSIDLLLARRGD